jgi:hypothetical protein
MPQLHLHKTGTELLAATGGLWLAYQLFNLSSFVRLHFLHRGTIERFHKSSKGEAAPAWALV